MLRRAAWWLIVYAAVIGAVAVLFLRLPTSFLPAEDQGYMIVNMQLPPGATQNRTLEVMEQVEAFILTATRSAEHGRRARFQLFRHRAERRAGFRDPEGLERTQGRTAHRRRHWPGAPSAR